MAGSKVGGRGWSKAWDSSRGKGRWDYEVSGSVFIAVVLGLFGRGMCVVLKYMLERVVYGKIR